MIKRNNKMVAIINIIFGIFMCVGWYLFTKCMMIDVVTYWGLSRMQNILAIMGTVALIFPLLTTTIINVIYSIKNRDNKKIMICNICTIIIIILSIALALLFRNYNFIFLIAIVSFFGIMILLLNKNEYKEKKHRLLLVIGILNVIVFAISCVMFAIVISGFDISFANNERNLIKNIMKLSDGENEYRPIKTKKNGKWGYIDNNGNVIIDFIYDDCTEFIEVQITNNGKKYYIATALEDNKLSLITNENKIIGTFTDKDKTRKLDCIGIIPMVEDNLKSYAEDLDLTLHIQNNEYEKNPVLLKVKDERFDYLFGENESDSNYLVFETNEVYNKGYNYKFMINTQTKKIIFNGKNVDIHGEVYLDEENLLKVYKNGYIPICDFEKNIFGWIDLDGEAHYIKGNIQILDFVDNYILVKIYTDDDEKICFINYENKIVSGFYKEVTILTNGYIVKKENGKNVYIDKNFKEITGEYDIIDGCREGDGILVVCNLPQKQDEELFSVDMLFDVVNSTNGKTIIKNIEYINGMKSTKYQSNLYSDITGNEYKEILCSVDSEFVNDELYKRYYSK